MKTIYLIGDSICHTNTEETYPQFGWGQVFSDYIKTDYIVCNLALNGRSSKSFFDEGAFEECQKNIKEGDYLFINFGHNDEKEDAARHTDPFTTYKHYLKYYIDVAKEHNATPVLISSIYRRHFKDGKIEENCHLDYPKAMESLSHEENVTYIDMCEITKNKLVEMGEENSKELYMNFGPNVYENYINGSNDNSHLREKGARFVCELLIKELKKYTKIKDILR